MSYIDLSAIGPHHDDYLSAVGRALAVCQHLEDCAHHVMVVWAVTDGIAEGRERDDLRAIARRLRNVGLGGATQRLGDASDFGTKRAQALEEGLKARNWLAHEAATIVEERLNKRDRFAQRVGELRSQVVELCRADAVMATSSYEICEREPAPSLFAGTYADRLADWVLEPVSGSGGSAGSMG